LLLLLQGFDHPVQLQALEGLDGRVGQHRALLAVVFQW
jgi:hypothetical protein